MVKITRRQAQVIALMREGKGRTLIAARLGVDPLTVYNHQQALTKKGVVSKGTQRGVRRQVLVPPEGLQVETCCRTRAHLEGSVRNAQARGWNTKSYEEYLRKHREKCGC